MKRMIVVPDGWPCILSECPPGFFVYDGELCFKSEYRTKGEIQMFCESGEAFWGGTSDQPHRDGLEVQPVAVEWEDYELE